MSNTDQKVGLIVRTAFENYSVGQRITDEASIKKILDSEHATYVDKFYIDEYTPSESDGSTKEQKKGGK